MNQSIQTPEFEKELNRLLLQDQIQAEKLVRIFIFGCFVFGAILVYKYDTYWYGWGIGSLTIVLYYIGKKYFPYTFAQRLLNSTILQLYIIQFIYQMHGLYEMHFTFFAITAMLIIYKDIWALIISGFFPIVQHLVLFTLQLGYGYDLREYFINIDNLTVEILVYHLGIAAAHLVVVGTFCVVLKRNLIDNFKDKINLMETDAIKKYNSEIVQKNEEILQQHEEIEQTLHVVNEQKKLIEKKNNDHIASINYALRIQNAIIPKQNALQKYVDCFVFFRPRDIVSGDFYWFAHKENTKIIAIADCTGHGVSGAFMTMIGNSMLNQIVHENDITAPDEILNRMPILLQKTLSHSDNKIQDGMDIAIITIQKNENTTKLAYAGANRPLYYYENKELKTIKADKKAIDANMDKNFVFQKHELIFDSQENNTTLYLCSDGFQDQFGGGENRKFMTKNLKELLIEIAEKPLAEQKQILEQTFENWKGYQKQTDDVLLIGLGI